MSGEEEDPRKVVKHRRSESTENPVKGTGENSAFAMIYKEKSQGSIQASVCSEADVKQYVSVDFRIEKDKNGKRIGILDTFLDLYEGSQKGKPISGLVVSPELVEVIRQAVTDTFADETVSVSDTDMLASLAKLVCDASRDHKITDIEVQQIKNYALDISSQTKS